LLAALLAVCLAAGETTRAMTLSNTPREQTCVTDYIVHAIARTTDTVYIGGEFNYVGPYTGGGTPLDNATGKTVAGLAKVNGCVYACLSDGVGGWFIGGEFTFVGNVARNRLAHILANNTVDANWSPGTNDSVYAMVASGSTIYIGGAFTSINGQPRGRIASLAAATGVLNNWSPNATGPSNCAVYALAVSDSAVFAGGIFSNIGGEARSNLAQLDPATGMASTSMPIVTGDTYCCVYVLTYANSILYIGGNFTAIGYSTRNNLGAFNTATGSVTTWNPNVQCTSYVPYVCALTISGSTVYIGGEFSTVGGLTRNNIAALSLDTGIATNWNPNADSSVSALALSGSTLYAGGYFKNIGGLARNNVAALDTATGAATDWNPTAGDGVNALAVFGSTVYAGGYFSSIGGKLRNRIAALDAATGAVTEWNPGATDVVFALAASDSTVYAGGYFKNIGGLARNRIAAVDRKTGAVTPWDPALSGSSVMALTVSGQTVYAGGNFSKVGGQSHVGVAAIDAATAIATNWNPGLDAPCSSVAVSGPTVYVAGEFWTVDNQNQKYIAALDATTNALIKWNPQADRYLSVIALSGSTVYAGGTFANIGGQERIGVAALDATTSTGAATVWNPNLDYAGVEALAVSGSKVFAGGMFSKSNGQTHSKIATLDIATGAATGWDPGLVGNAVHAVSASSTGLYVAGEFTFIGDQHRTYFAQFDAVSFDVCFQTDGTPGATLNGSTAQTVAPGGAGSAVKANAPVGYDFIGWTRDGVACSTDNPQKVSHVMADMTLVAHFSIHRNGVGNWALYD